MHNIIIAMNQNQVQEVKQGTINYWLLLMMLIAGCSASTDISPEAQIKMLIQTMEAAIEERNTSVLFEHVSEHYKDHKGNDKKALRRFFMGYILRNQSIAIVTNINSLEVVNDTNVAVEASAVMAGKTGTGSKLLPQLSADTQQVSAVFQLEDGAWKLISMSWDYQSHY